MTMPVTEAMKASKSKASSAGKSSSQPNAQSSRAMKPSSDMANM
jgi:hypothetical protein